MHPFDLLKLARRPCTGDLCAGRLRRRRRRCGAPAGRGERGARRRVHERRPASSPARRSRSMPAPPAMPTATPSPTAGPSATASAAAASRSPPCSPTRATMSCASRSATAAAASPSVERLVTVTAGPAAAGSVATLAVVRDASRRPALRRDGRQCRRRRGRRRPAPTDGPRSAPTAASPRRSGSRSPASPISSRRSRCRPRRKAATSRSR